MHSGEFLKFMSVISSSADQALLLTEVLSDKNNTGGNALVESRKQRHEVAFNVADDGHAVKQLRVMLQK